MAKPRWSAAAVTQVTKSNFTHELKNIRAHILDSDYIAVSAQKTGGARKRWHRVLPFDTAQTAYLKAKLAAETYELFQFSVCPFRISGSKVVAFPYNFHLFPRDELNVGMPSYSFTCQASFMTSMAKEGFDFNTCIYDGLSYLSRVQESEIKDRFTLSTAYQMAFSSSYSAADAIFMERVKSKVMHWRSICKGPGKTNEDALLTSLRKLILASEFYGSRPCLSIDVCSSRQVQLIMQALNQSFGDVIPIVVPDVDRGAKAVRVVLTDSEDDRRLLLSELKQQEDDHNMKIRGFREVIDLMSSSQKPIIACDCLNDFAFIHSKFLAPLPPTIGEFMCSLRLAFSDILDVKHLMKEVNPLQKAKNLPAAISYLRRRFSAPVDIEILQDSDNPVMNHGHNILRLTHLFAKLCSILNITPAACHEISDHATSVEDYSNIFVPCCSGLQDLEEEHIESWPHDAKKVSTRNVIFVWGFRDGTSAVELKTLLRGCHDAFSEDFELRLFDRCCAIVVLWQEGAAESLLENWRKGETHSSAMIDLMSDGLKMGDYKAYKKVCELGLWTFDLADCFDREALRSEDDLAALDKDSSEIYWPDGSKMTLDDL